MVIGFEFGNYRISFRQLSKFISLARASKKVRMRVGKSKRSLPSGMPISGALHKKYG